MLVIRPIAEADLDPLFELVRHATFGLSTLPPDREHLQRRIRRSLRAFEHMKDHDPGSESYLLVMEDSDTAALVGAAGLMSKVGGFEPFYAYRIETTVQASAQIHVRKEVRTLHLVTEHNGPSEIGSLFLHPAYRGGGRGRFLSLARFLFIADFPAFFDASVIAEMRGVIDSEGGNPFWDAIGRHFFEIPLTEADYLSVMNKQFIADLVPRHPIYIALLPPEAQAVIGQVHPQTLPALRILQEEGFGSTGMVDIFEAGPCISCDRDSIRIVRDAQRAIVTRLTEESSASGAHLVSNGRFAFRCCMTQVQRDGEGVVLPEDAAAALQVDVGDTVTFVPLRATGQGSQTSA